MLARGANTFRKHEHMHHRHAQRPPQPGAPAAAHSPGSSGRRQRSRLSAQPSRPDVAALEAALGAINKILGAYNNRGRPPGAPTSPGAPPAPQQGKSKLIKFRAKANSSVTVKELLSVPDDSPPDSSSSDSSSAPAHGSTERHTHASRLGAAGRAGSKAQPQHFEGQLQAYLALPLDEYALLDPSLISRLPDGCDVNAYLSEQLEEQQRRRAARKQPPPPGQQQLLAGLQQDGSSSGDSSSSSSTSGDGVRGVSLEPKMRALDEPQQQEEQQQQQDSQQPPDAGHASEASATSSNNSGSSSSPKADGPPAAAPAGGGVLQPVPVSAPTSTGFLLRIPMLELLGVDLEPLLVIFVDIDPHKAQVRFHTDRLVVGNAPQFNREFKVALTALLTSKPQRAAVQIEAGGAGTDAAAAAAADADAGVAAADAEQAASPAAAGSSSGTDEQQQRRPQWQRSSSLSCKVDLQMTLRLPHPLSIVPGPLLSTAASLVAKLVMQALLPSFLELLANDYGRWASGSSTASRQAVAAGSLLTAGKQQLQRMGR